MRYRLPAGTRIKRTYEVPNPLGGASTWGWEEIVTTKDAVYTDGDISAKVQDAEAIEFKVPDKDFPLIHVALRDLDTLCKVCSDPYNPNVMLHDVEMCGPCYNHGGQPLRDAHCSECSQFKPVGYGPQRSLCKACLYRG